MKFGPFFFLNRLVANKTIPTIKAIINTLKAKKDKMAKPKIIQNAKANLVVKGIFCLGPRYPRKARHLEQLPPLVAQQRPEQQRPDA